MAATLALGASAERCAGSSPVSSTSEYEVFAHALKRGPSPHYIFNMSAHRARIPTKLLPTPDVVYVNRGGMGHSGWQSSK